MKRSLRSWLWRVPVEREVDEELAFHLEMRARQFMARGMAPEEARARARYAAGDLASLRDTCVELGRRRDRTMRVRQWIDEVRSDVRFAVRQLVRAPGFAMVAVLTLALGIGANGAIFALVDAALLRPLPLPDPGRVVALWERSPTGDQENVAPLNAVDWNARAEAFERIAGYLPSVGGMVVAADDGTADTVSRQWVTYGIFDALGVRAIHGRTFTADDDRQVANVVVFSERFWRARFGGDPSVVGRSFRLDGDPYTLVGIVPNEAELLGQSSMWALVTIGNQPELRSARFLRVIGRMKPDVTIDAATADLARVADGLAREHPDTNAGRGVIVEPLHAAVVGRDLRLTSMLFLGVVGIVLLICCANVANLLMARATARTREMAVRAALGAGRFRVVRQLLTESVVLSAIGGVMAMAVGAAILEIAPILVPQGLLPATIAPVFDLRVAAFCALTGIVVGILFGLAPAWQTSSGGSTDAIGAETRTMTGRGGRLRSLLVVSEVATAVLLLFGAGLLLRTLVAVNTIDRGYRADSILTMTVDPLGSRYPTPEALLQFYDSLKQEIEAVPGVAITGWASTLPLGESMFGDLSYEIVGDPPVNEARRPSADYQIVSPDYFPAIDLPIVAGRAFNDRDTLDTEAVCIVNEAFVRRHMPGRSPVGAQVALRLSEAPDAAPVVRRIVGVARQVRARPDEQEAFVQVYVPLEQSPTGDIFLVVRPESGRADALASPVRAAIGRMDKEQLVSVRDVITLDEVAWTATGRHRFRAALVATFAGLAVVLAMVGVFGVLAYSVQQRVREIALRRALGASTGDVVRLVLGNAAGVIATGLAIGLGLATLSGRLLSSMLFGVTPLDPLTFAAVVGVLILMTTLAVVAPVWRAVRVDPAVAMREV